MPYLFYISGGTLHVYSLPHFAEVHRAKLHYWRPSIHDHRLFLTNAGFHKISVFDLESLRYLPMPSLSHFLGEYYTIVWLDSDTFLSIGLKSWWVSLSKREMTKLWKNSTVVHMEFGCAVDRQRCVYLVGGDCANVEDLDSDGELKAKSDRKPFTGVVEISLVDFSTTYYRAVLPKALLSPSVVCLSGYSLLIFGGQQELDSDLQVVNMECYLFNPWTLSFRKCGSLPGEPELIHSYELCGSQLFAVFEFGDVLQCDLRTGLARRYDPRLWLARKAALWALKKNKRAMPAGLMRAVVCDYLAVSDNQ